MNAYLDKAVKVAAEIHEVISELGSEKIMQERDLIHSNLGHNIYYEKDGIKQYFKMSRAGANFKLDRLTRQKIFKALCTIEAQRCEAISQQHGKVARNSKLNKKMEKHEKANEAYYF